MKVALIYDLTEYGGVQTCVFSLIKGLNNKNIVPTIIWDKKPSEEIIKNQNLKVEFLKTKFTFSSKFIKKFPNSIRYLMWALNFKKISNFSNAFEFFYIFYPLIKIDENVKHIFYLSGPPLLPQLESKKIHFKIVKLIYKILIKPFYPAYEVQKKANYVINSIFTSEMFREAHGKNLEVVYPSNQFKRSNDEYSIVDRNLITFFSRIVDYKRPDLIIELAVRYPNSKFVIMGLVTTNNRKFVNILKEKTKQLDNVEILENVSIEKINEVFKKTKIYFFPAKNEHFGITTVEAILKGAIPFVHDSGGQKEIVPIDELRFKDVELFSKFHTLNDLNEKDLKIYHDHLKENLIQFEEDTYIRKMLKYVV